jgi:hypothetical protein
MGAAASMVEAAAVELNLILARMAARRWGSFMDLPNSTVAEGRGKAFSEGGKLLRGREILVVTLRLGAAVFDGWLAGVICRVANADQRGQADFYGE